MADSESSRSNKSEEGEGTGFFFLIEMAGVATIIGLRGCGAGVSVAVLEFALGATTFFAETEFGATCAAITATGSVAALFNFYRCHHLKQAFCSQQKENYHAQLCLHKY